MSQPTRIGIVGCGSVMQRPYMRLIQPMRATGNVDVTIACDIREAIQPVVQDVLGIDRFTTDYEEVIDSDVDVVMVLTSMLEHGPITRAALAAGKHVLVEKPMAVTLEEAAEIVEMARSSPGLLVCAPHVVLSNTYQTMWRHIQRGDIGKVLMARARYGHSGPDWRPWFYLEGGGALFDLGVYNITCLTGWLGPAKRVMAMTGVAIPERVVGGEMMRVEAEDNAHVLIDWGENVFGVVTTGFTMQKYRSPALEIYGSQGTIQMTGDDWAPTGYELWRNDVGAWQIHEGTDRSWTWTDGIRHLIECIQEGTTPIVQPEHAYHVLEIMIKAQESGRDGQSKELGSTFTPPTFEEEEEEEIAEHLVHDWTQR